MLGIQRLILAFLLCFEYQICQCSGFLYEEYYWQDFEGEVPFNALAGGKDATGKPIYIGQVLIGGKLLPAKIYVNDNKAYYTWGYEMSTTVDVKILCTEHPERFTWIPTKKDEIHKLINQRLVKGGWEPSYDLYIGRAFYNLQTLVGRIRVFGNPVSNLGLYISADGKEVILDSFEILAHAAEVNGSDIRYCGRRFVILQQ
ncbi:hypothetical protein RN001_013908 [Aquatica leii]|uniref:DUF3421 domain containing protein n=1 Tax=Aquatica leii TaxID=1421715 RepID=A0AAN7QDJ0_9COLE|nr:hypothetical protein RN001_013908 [Aquatica leii]